MAGLYHPWAFAFGVLGNVISFMVYLAPVPTFYRIWKKRSTEGFQAVPYVIALFSAMLMIYYALIKGHSFLLITINATGCVIETIYIVLFLLFAPKSARVYTLKLLTLLNVLVYCVIVGLTLGLLKGSKRVKVVGLINVGFSMSVFAAPLSIIKLVIQTKSVEFMPFTLSFFLTVSAVVWFAYGALIKDIYVAMPNVLGFFFGVAQMVLYVVVKYGRQASDQGKDPEKGAVGPPAHRQRDLAIKQITTAGSEVHPIEVSQASTPEEGESAEGQRDDGGGRGNVMGSSGADVELKAPHP